MSRAYLGLGSNLGDRAANLEAAVTALEATEGIAVVLRSAVRETEPLDAPPPAYLNAVVAVDTRLSPLDLLARCQEIENALGRTRSFLHAPRTIDLDILLYDDLVMDAAELVLPHPGLLRPFVIEPLIEIAPGLVHPATGLPLHQAAASARSDVRGQSGNVAKKVRP